MKLFVEKDYEKLSKVAANIVKEEMSKKPNMVLGLATGSTPEGMYRELIRMHKEDGLDFSNVITFNLDEYVGIDVEHPNSYHYFMKNILFNHINIDLKNTYIPDGKANDLEKYCEEYDELIQEKGGIDLQILGIGENGHIAFNEPDDTLNVGTSVVDLTQSTIEANSRFFDSIDEVPKTAITMGIGTIMKAKKIILLANGKKKAKVIKELLREDKITTQLPASMLLLHPDVTVIIDEEAYQG
ncbi:glucosamine-6-phosphate deaminase [Schnuerera sp.]|uniref:glucosamine-6-phosphate deaminase n=1 Tax=Schnuerera sp. TaxID=2794844 RepID=UPI002BA698E4|nr:glucosamine-6-phosphate deaminase [Schnuerera sp.]HSH34891.1 glucosamine-6-phosphate deaminase [Schnuerera sp.]